MSVHSKFIPIGIIAASAVLTLLLVSSPSFFSVALAAEEVPAIAPAAVETLNEQTQGDETQLRPSQPQMMNNDGDFWGGWWIIMSIMMVFFWGGVLWFAVWGIRQFTGDRASGHSPLEIAKERRAKGEISQDEFDEIKRDLA